jgi:hypothetical protein
VSAFVRKVIADGREQIIESHPRLSLCDPIEEGIPEA